MTRFRILTVAALVAFLATSCFYYKRPPFQTVDPEQPRVSLIGDSIMGLPHVELKVDIQTNTQWWVGSLIHGAWVSSDVAANDGPMIEPIGLIPNAVIIELGSFESVVCFNLGNCDLASWVPQSYIDLLIEYDQIGIDCIVVVNTADSIDPPHTPINDAADSLEASGVVDHVVDWKSAVDANPSYVYDHYGHQTQEGQDAFAVLVADEFEATCGNGA